MDPYIWIQPIAFYLGLQNPVSYPQQLNCPDGQGSLAPFVRGKCRVPRLEAACAGRIMQGLEQCGASGMTTGGQTWKLGG